jgi:hypothetical protein
MRKRERLRGSVRSDVRPRRRKAAASDNSALVTNTVGWTAESDQTSRLFGRRPVLHRATRDLN